MTVFNKLGFFVDCVRDIARFVRAELNFRTPDPRKYNPTADVMRRYSAWRWMSDGRWDLRDMGERSENGSAFDHRPIIEPAIVSGVSKEELDVRLAVMGLQASDCASDAMPGVMRHLVVPAVGASPDGFRLKVFGARTFGTNARVEIAYGELGFVFRRPRTNARPVGYEGLKTFLSDLGWRIGKRKFTAGDLVGIRTYRLKEIFRK